MKLVKEMSSVRVDPLVKAVVKAEAKHENETEADMITRWVLQSAGSPEAKRLITGRIEQDPLLSAANRLSIIEATRRKVNPQKVKRVAARSVRSARKKAGLKRGLKADAPSERKP